MLRPCPNVTFCSRANYTWSYWNFCAISLVEFLSKQVVAKRPVTDEKPGKPYPFNSILFFIRYPLLDFTMKNCACGESVWDKNKVQIKKKVICITIISLRGGWKWRSALTWFRYYNYKYHAQLSLFSCSFRIFLRTCKLILNSPVGRNQSNKFISHDLIKVQVFKIK